MSAPANFSWTLNNVQVKNTSPPAVLSWTRNLILSWKSCGLDADIKKVGSTKTLSIDASLYNIGIINKDKVWIAHGDNVITFTTDHYTTIYKMFTELVQAPMGGITDRNVAETQSLKVFTYAETSLRGHVRIEGGYGFTSHGFTGSNSAVVEKFDDISNAWTAITVTGNLTARMGLGGYSLNGYGFISCGGTGDSVAVGDTCRVDTVALAGTTRTAATARMGIGSYSMNGFGYTCCGTTDVTNVNAKVATTQKLDDNANTQSTVTSGELSRWGVSGFSINNLGFTCGAAPGTSPIYRRDINDICSDSGSTVRYGRYMAASYALNGYGFIVCGGTGASTGWPNAVISASVAIQRYDDTAGPSTTTTRATTETARWSVAGFSLNGYGFTTGGQTAASTYVGTTNRFDDTANTITTRDTLNTARSRLATFATNEYFINYVTAQ